LGANNKNDDVVLLESQKNISNGSKVG